MVGLMAALMAYCLAVLKALMMVGPLAKPYQIILVQ